MLKPTSVYLNNGKTKIASLLANKTIRNVGLHSKLLYVLLCKLLLQMFVVSDKFFPSLHKNVIFKLKGLPIFREVR